MRDDTEIIHCDLLNAFLEFTVKEREKKQFIPWIILLLLLNPNFERKKIIFFSIFQSDLLVFKY